MPERIRHVINSIIWIFGVRITVRVSEKKMGPWGIMFPVPWNFGKIIPIKKIPPTFWFGK